MEKVNKTKGKNNRSQKTGQQETCLQMWAVGRLAGLVNTVEEPQGGEEPLDEWQPLGGGEPLGEGQPQGEGAEPPGQLMDEPAARVVHLYIQLSS
jgi:hypothetical protein